jgi:hypothetical protein
MSLSNQMSPDLYIRKRLIRFHQRILTLTSKVVKHIINNAKDHEITTI